MGDVVSIVDGILAGQDDAESCRIISINNKAARLVGYYACAVFETVDDDGNPADQYAYEAGAKETVNKVKSIKLKKLKKFYGKK